MEPIYKDKIRSCQRIGNTLIASTLDDRIIVLAEFYEPDKESKKVTKKREPKRGAHLGSWTKPQTTRDHQTVLSERQTNGGEHHPSDAA